MSHSRSLCWVAFLLTLAGNSSAAEPAHGWRGNGTGLWPAANAPLEWSRTPHGALEGLRAAANSPKGIEAGDAALVEKGLIHDWLVVGPFAVKDSVTDFDADQFSGEANVSPSAGQKVAERTWTAATATADDPTVFGTAELPWLDLAKAIDFQRNQLAYAHTYLYSLRGGPARIVVDHGHGLKAWVNGRVAYRSPQRGVGLGFYVQLSRRELAHDDTPSPRFDVDLKPGWNRLLLKLSTSNKADFTDMRCSLRIMDPPDVKYESKNIRWMTPLPGRSTSTPLPVGDRLFVMAEPDELLCIDAKTGRVLWVQAVNYYKALTPEERKANPAFAEKVGPLVVKLKRETDPSKRTRLRAEIQKNLMEIDPALFRVAADGHFESHFGIVGFTMPTPVSDGKHVWVWSGMGVAACFDLDGRRQWITRVVADELSYGSSPAVADGVLVVFQHGLYGLDAKTGKILWEQKKIRNNVAALLATTVAGKSVIVTQRGDFVRPTDGAVLWRQRGSNAPGDTGWAPGVILGDRLYQPNYGVTNLGVFDLSAVNDQWEPKLLKAIHLPEEVSRKPNGAWIDRWTAGSPLIHDGIAYLCDIYHEFYAVDLTSGKMLYRKVLPLSGLMHYNAVPVAASVTLVGKHLLVCDNQGTTVVLEPGPTYKLVARNVIATQLDRRVPIPAQETLAYAPPVVVGDCIYLRGERYLYCVGND